MNDKFTKRYVLSAAGLYTIIFGLIVATCFVGKMLGIEEFQSLFQEVLR